ncbi:type II toxin-antitoxin system VapC family toxin [Plectonema cf. radiosum LEGE 06105]|uniref:Type II toxin-antitoxin system VapC family toxin n=1 Tax=Plectonema cf. radiosum LEGE 06105 TaxID=945769 RepID=A0A8J7F665_9CYAN|nr:type II toxin-antitoxin system VapC family toxin [Plectonema radiosum]MBE9215253.1 type II toxin-antitoxin system VapC family toxin [Plectonema cf. radiosum LEGE 06105]
MNVLLDTHVLIWWSISPSNLSENVYKLLDDQVNNLFFSLASIWEMQIKLQIGKLTLNLPLPELIEDQCQTK